MVPTPEQLAEYELRATMAERERCAKIADAAAALQTDDEAMQCFALDIAAEIRG